MVTSRVSFHWTYRSGPSQIHLMSPLSDFLGMGFLDFGGESNIDLPDSATGSVLQPVQIEGCAGVEVVDIHMKPFSKVCHSQKAHDCIVAQLSLIYVLKSQL